MSRKPLQCSAYLVVQGLGERRRNIESDPPSSFLSSEHLIYPMHDLRTDEHDMEIGEDDLRVPVECP